MNKIRGLRWYVLALFMVGTVINYGLLALK